MIYDKIAKDYDKKLAPFERKFLAKWREETLSHLPKDANLLEIGAGTGLNFRFYPKCKHSVASEISCKMLELAKAKNENENLSLVQTDAQILPFAANSFDAAFATLVFCAIPNPEKAFAELKRVVRKNGKIILLEHVRPKGLLGYLFDFLNIFTVRLMEDHFNRETAKIAENSGLKILKVRPKAFGIVNLIICENEKDETGKLLNLSLSFIYYILLLLWNICRRRRIIFADSEIDNHNFPDLNDLHTTSRLIDGKRRDRFCRRRHNRPVREYQSKFRMAAE